MEIKKQDSTTSVFRFTLICLQIFGFMPVCGILQDNISKIKFSWTSFRCLYSIVTFLGFLFLNCLQFFRLTIHKLRVAEMLRMYFFLKSVWASYALIKLAKNWREFASECIELDTRMASYGWPKNLKKRMKIVVVTFWVAFVGNLV